MPTKVLIADDERVARKVLETFLLREGYEVVLAEDGASALKCAMAFTEPYIAILDWVMPGVTGLQVCACLRSPKMAVRPYVIMLSARSEKSDIATALDAGADDFLTKPFNQLELMALGPRRIGRRQRPRSRPTRANAVAPQSSPPTSPAGCMVARASRRWCSRVRLSSRS